VLLLVRIVHPENTVQGQGIRVQMGTVMLVIIAQEDKIQLLQLLNVQQVNTVQKDLQWLQNVLLELTLQLPNKQLVILDQLVNIVS